ncbi:immunoglobulin-like domain-containing protein, partial [Exiguobacterium sp. 8H]
MFVNKIEKKVIIKGSAKSIPLVIVFVLLFPAIPTFANPLERNTNSELPMTILDPYYQGQNHLSGEVTNEVKKVRLYKKGEYVRSGTIQDGKFKVYTRDVHPQPKEEWSLISVDSNNEVLEEIQFEPLRSKAFINAYDKFTYKDSSISGTSEGAKVIRIYVNNIEKRAVKVKEDGSFLIYVEDLNLNKKDRIEMVALDSFNHEGIPLEVQEVEQKTKGNVIEEEHLSKEEGDEKQIFNHIYLNYLLWG